MRFVASLLFVTACAADGSSMPPDPPEPPANVANGQLDAWQSATPLLVARANHCSAVIGDTVFLIGGNRKVGDSFVKTDEIHAGKVAADGTITWSLAGKTPSPVSECTATADGKRLFILDGLYDRESDSRQVFTADFDGTTLSALTPFAAMPQIAISSEAAVRDGALLMMDTMLPAEGDKTVTLRTPTAAAAWTTDDWAIGFRAQAQYAFTDAFAYTIGGYSGAEGNPVQSDVFVATIGKDGAISQAHPTAPLPTPTCFGEAVAVDDYVFVAGGRAQVFGANGTTAVYASHVASDGSLGAWQAVAALPMGRTNHELAVVGDYLVLTGGAVNGPGDTTVLTARVRFPAM